MQLVGRMAISLALLAAVSPAFAAGSISATGYGRVVAPPDTAFLSFSLSTDALGTDTVLKANGELVARVTDKLKAEGIQPNDIQTGSFSLRDAKEPENCGDYDYKAEKIIPCTFEGHRVSTAFTLRIRKLEGFGEVVAAAIAAGAEDISGLTLTIADADTLRDAAYAAALRDARRRAELTATTLEVSLGDLTSARETEYGSRRGPATLAEGIEVSYNYEEAADLMVLPYGAILSGGELTFNSAADVTYDIVQ